LPIQLGICAQVARTNPDELAKKLPPFDRKSGNLNVIIDTPKGCRSKFAFDMKRKAYVLKSVLPQGALFPFDFGSIPGTVAEDGDPVDALVLMDEPAFCGFLIESRLLGVIEAEQSENGKTNRNDRLIAVAAKSQTHAEIKSLSDLSSALLKEIEHFFIFYNQERGKKFRPLARHGPKRAARLVREQKRKGGK
jgi:inorganic pyrophosphatase